jgi:hypothetical protein
VFLLIFQDSLPCTFLNFTNEIFCTSNSELLNEDLIRECERLAQVIQMKIKALPEECLISTSRRETLAKNRRSNNAWFQREHLCHYLRSYLNLYRERSEKLYKKTCIIWGADRQDSRAIRPMTCVTIRSTHSRMLLSSPTDSMLNRFPSIRSENLYSLCRAYSVNSAPHLYERPDRAVDEYIQERHSETNAIMTSVN